MKTLGIILISIGILFFVYKGVTYKTQEKVLDVGSIHVTQEETKHIPFSPILGGAAIVGGIVLVVLARKRVS